VELEPWEKEGQQQLMRLLVATARQAEALDLYEAHRRVLEEELGVEPAAETTQLYEQIQQGQLDFPPLAPAPDLQPEPTPRLPGFLLQEADTVAAPVFVAREQQ
jgi:DNA-binding SARP family transcriptional activator